MKQPVLMAIFGITALSMGTFVSVTYYLDFRLEAPPFSFHVMRLPLFYKVSNRL